MHTRWILLLAVLGAGCATNPANVSYLYGERYHRVKINTFATHITAIDGRATMPHSEPIQVEPGRHLIRLVTAPAAGFSVAEIRELDLEVEPCRRYYIVAERGNRLQQDWRPVIDHAEVADGKDCH